MTFKVKTKGQNEGEKLLEPKLRFKEFDDNYIKHKLSEVVNFYKGNILSKSDIIEGGKTPCILYGELYTRYSEIAYEIFSFTNNSNSNLFYSKKNDILIPCSGETALDISTSTCVLSDNIAIGGDLNVLRSKDQSGKYLSYLLNHKKRLEIAKYAQGDSIVHLYANKIRNINMYLPSYMEQEKIANLLSLLDKKIELQKRRIEALKIYKKGLISHIFNGIHSTKKLKTIVNFQNGKGYENQVDINGNYNLVSLNSITIDGKLNKFMKKIKSDLPISTLKKNDIVMIMSDVGHGDFLGVSAIIPDDNVYVLNQRVGLLRINDNTIPSYLLYAINNLQPYFKKYGQGSSQLNLSKEDILNANIPYIDIHSQEDLSNFCILLDKKIFNAEFKLENLKNLKKSLLQQMFI